jgi:hypothetical protein
VVEEDAKQEFIFCACATRSRVRTNATDGMYPEFSLDSFRALAGKIATGSGQ